MNRNFYRLSIFVTALYIAITFFQAIIQSRQGLKMLYLKAFVPWFFLAVIMNFAGSVILARYYQHKKYKAAFSTVVAVAIISIFYFIVAYHVVTGNALAAHYTAAYQLMLLAAMAHAIVLVFSKARERIWLKAAGMFGLILAVTQLSFFWAIMSSQSFQLRHTLGEVQQWVAVVGSLGLVLYIKNFRDELNAMETEKSEVTPYLLSNTVTVFTMMVVFAATLFLSFNLATDKRKARLAQNRPASPEAERLALRFEARVYVNAQGDTLPYRLMKPLNYDPLQKYPLMVCLHHGGAHGTDNVIQVEGGGYAQVLSDDAYRAKYPAFIFVPQCPVGSSWGGITQLPEIMPLVIEAMATLEKEFSIDEKRRYVAGISGGGFGSWHFIAKHPEMFAAAIPICGGADPSLAKNVVNVPVWAFHGDQDQNVPVGFSRDMINAMRDAGGNPKYTEFPGEGHNIWESVIQTPGVLDWLFEQKRK
ncbi:dienelactone hydrolase family protein [Fulvivirgaceae bacterium PWU4]|uniref:Dienelactone hydrolase family protein n=1 Tax=Chryseosolibacter histidini TaxID=2782349 RepID=A0AAP2DPJ5_9BACT|nr:alpha/beta hydrolase-fold protein [Chryseosolibacter histidini]MBT1700185.1 dienelactone hydrolase family protein [Chryseosolibacter histidini]